MLAALPVPVESRLGVHGRELLARASAAEGKAYVVATDGSGKKRELAVPTGAQVVGWMEIGPAGQAVAQSTPTPVAPNPTATVPITSTPALKPADSEYPAAGICEGAEGLLAVVEVNPDVPSPRCQKAKPEQWLQVVNKTSRDVRVRLGPVDVTIKPQAETTSCRSFGGNLTRGVRRLAISVYGEGGVDLWSQE